MFRTSTTQNHCRHSWTPTDSEQESDKPGDLGKQKLWQDKSPYWGQEGSIRQNRRQIWATTEFKERLEDEINGSTLETEIEASTAVIRKYHISEKWNSVWKFQRKKWTSQKQWGKKLLKCVQTKRLKLHAVNKAEKAQHSWEAFNKHHSASDWENKEQTVVNLMITWIQEKIRSTGCK